MSRISRQAIILLVVTYSVLIVSACYTQKFYERDRRARVILEKVAIWFITEGAAEYYQGKGEYFLEQGVEQFGAHLATKGVIENVAYPSIIEIHAEYFWVVSIISCYSRVESNDSIYEYWVVKRFSGTRDDVGREVYFLIAKASGLDKKREIIHRTERFFSKFETPDGTVIRFPLDDNKTVNHISPWKYPEAYKGTELDGVIVKYINKQYVRSKVKQEK